MSGETLFGGPEPKKKRAPRGLADECIGWWRANYPSNVFDARGEPVAYRMHPADGGAVQALVREFPTLTLDQFQRRATALLRTRDRFWFTNRTLRVLCSRWSDIASLEVLERGDAKKSSIGNPPTVLPDAEKLSDRARLERIYAEQAERFKRMRPPL